MSEHITHLNDAGFEQDVLQSQLPVLVDYWAEWCGPCKMIAPILDEISKEYAGRLKIQSTYPSKIWHSRHSYANAI